MRPLHELYSLWDSFGDIPVSDEGTIKEPFLHFNVGASREDVWHYFEAQNPYFICGDMMSGEQLDVQSILMAAKSNYIELIAADKHRLDVFLDGYRTTHVKDDSESELDYIHRCAEQDFEDGHSACFSPDFYDRAVGQAEASVHQSRIAERASQRGRLVQ